jgi:hypothetical protein
MGAVEAIFASMPDQREGEDMARSDKRYSVYPAPRAIEILGASAPELNQALECWAALLARAIADNSKVFRGPSDSISMLNEWGVLAEVLKGMRFDPEFAHPKELLATAVEDAHRLENIGSRWCQAFSGSRDEAVGKLVEKLRKLDYPHAWAIIVAVQWFWEHHEAIDMKKDPWWTLAFRRKWNQEHSGKKDAAAAEEPEKKKATKKAKRG